MTNKHFISKWSFLSLYHGARKTISSGHARSIKAKKNIVASFFIKGVSIGISLLLVPLTIHYINSSRYGIWLTLSSIVGWFSFFDIGLTQGLRNKFAEARAMGEDDLAKTYVSTTYAILIIIFGLTWIIFLIFNTFINWSSLLNVSIALNPEISALALIVFTYFCLQFVLRIIISLILADQQPAKASLVDVLGQVFSLLLIFILVKTTQGSLVKLGLALCIAPLAILCIANVIFFKTIFKKYKPSFSAINFGYAKKLFNLGMIFFVIQIAAVTQYETANIIIARSFGTAEVTSYNIVYKYFSVLNMVFMIFLTPFWSASTEAFMNKDFQWIKSGIKKYNQLNLILILVGLIMLFFSAEVFNFWIGNISAGIPFSLSLWGFIYFSTAIFAGKYVNFLNGISALRIQFVSSIITPFLYIAASLLLIRVYHLGIASLFIASVIANLNGFILAPIQYYQVIYKNKKGIWIK